MIEYRSNTEAGQLESTVAFRMSTAERDQLARLARANDRTPAGELRRAVRFYLDNFKTIDRALRKRAETMY